MHLSYKIFSERIQSFAVGAGLIGMSITSTVFAILLAGEITKPAVIVERECETRIAKISSRDQTIEEIDSFLRKALIARFDNDPGIDPSMYLATELMVRRQKEQTELQIKSMDQRLIIREIKKEKDQYLITADRLLAIENARSALPVKMKASILSRPRSLSNPYGLLLTKAELLADSEIK